MTHRCDSFRSGGITRQPHQLYGRSLSNAECADRQDRVPGSNAIDDLSSKRRDF